MTIFFWNLGKCQKFIGQNIKCSLYSNRVNIHQRSRESAVFYFFSRSWIRTNSRASVIYLDTSWLWQTTSLPSSNDSFSRLSPHLCCSPAEKRTTKKRVSCFHVVLCTHTSLNPPGNTNYFHVLKDVVKVFTPAALLSDGCLLWQLTEERSWSLTLPVSLHYFRRCSFHH